MFHRLQTSFVLPHVIVCIVYRFTFCRWPLHCLHICIFAAGCCIVCAFAYLPHDVTLFMNLARIFFFVYLHFCHTMLILFLDLHFATRCYSVYAFTFLPFAFVLLLKKLYFFAACCWILYRFTFCILLLHCLQIYVFATCCRILYKFTFSRYCIVYTFTFCHLPLHCLCIYKRRCIVRRLHFFRTMFHRLQTSFVLPHVIVCIVYRFTFCRWPLHCLHICIFAAGCCIVCAFAYLPHDVTLFMNLARIFFFVYLHFCHTMLILFLDLHFATRCYSVYAFTFLPFAFVLLLKKLYFFAACCWILYRFTFCILLLHCLQIYVLATCCCILYKFTFSRYCIVYTFTSLTRSM